MKENLELMAKLRTLKSAEEYRAFAEENGQKITMEEAEKAFEIIQNRLTPRGKELDENELASVNGGFGLPSCPDTANGKCHATVEDGSWCWGTDACFNVVVLYDITRYYG